MKELIKFFLYPIMPFYLGGGGGDGGLKEQRKQEAERQARIGQAVSMINNIFDGKSGMSVYGKLDVPTNVFQRITDQNGNRAMDPRYDLGTFDPNRTYYLADGTEWKAPTVTRTVTTSAGGRDDGEGLWLGGRKSKTKTVTSFDQEAITKALKQGLYAERSVYNPGAQSRQALYDEQRKAVTDLNRQDVDKQYEQAERNARFGLARSGLLGGSEDVDMNNELSEHRDRGLLQAASLGEAAAADLKMKDEQARQNLISQAQAGTDAGAAQTMALNQLGAAAQQAKSDRGAATIGDVFGDISKAYMMNQIRTGMQNGRDQFGTASYGAVNSRNGDSGMRSK